MPNLRKLALILTVVVALALTPSAGWGQNVYGSIIGVVTDTSGAAIANASVTLTNLDTGQKRTIESDASGDYSFPNLLPGRYKLEGEKTGFKKFVREPIVVQIESGLRVDIALPVGAQTETVEVTSESPLLQSETQSLGQVVEQRCRLGRAVVPVLVIEVDQNVAVQAIRSQQNQDNEIRNQQSQVESIGVI